MLCGETQGHFSLARMFSRRACDMGEERAWTLRAMAWDRWLVASGKAQRFGTQLIKQGGRWSLPRPSGRRPGNTRSTHGVDGWPTSSRLSLISQSSPRGTETAGPRICA